MTPRFVKDLRRMSPIIKGVLLFIAIAILWVFLTKEVKNQYTEYPVTPEPEELIWNTIAENNVLFWPVVDDKCVRENALMQVHEGTKVLVIHHHDNGMVEVALEDQSGENTIGCVSDAMLLEHRPIFCLTCESK